MFSIERGSAATTGTPRLGFLIIAFVFMLHGAASAQCCLCLGCIGNSSTCVDDVTAITCGQICTDFGCQTMTSNGEGETCATNCGVPIPTPSPDPRTKKCEAAKLKIADTYSSCRFKAIRKAVLTGRPPDFSRCDARFSDQWVQAETSGGGACPSNGDEAALRAFISADTNAVGVALGGGALPSCP